MALNSHALTALLLSAAALAGCSVSGPRESPLKEVTEGSPTVLDIYRGKAAGGAPERSRASPRDRLEQDATARPLAADDGRTQRYWSAVEPMQQRFARLANPDLVMVVYPHLAKGKYPVPGYVTVFPMYEQTEYALPGEVQEDLLRGRAAVQGRSPAEGGRR
ncbi:TIGR03751 family conjugal transfer lipoprotein [Paracidovorax oryzae]|uniref:TIGR03751 family conjugal transfer lipoprotein n=1 Tax=Paracidovorax oryzae TaxID=862720 RepID=UPI000496DA2A|nr:TIGR03751 family conjugal transfer lipoprotein [Paracidovorax oryzae]